jgi:hypothetical protein
MSDSNKYTTFRDLRSVSKSVPAPESALPSTSSISSAPSVSSTTRYASKPRTSSTGIAPERDFQRVPNSITKQAIPSGVFRGKSKQVWDYLWSISRGAIVPTRTVRKSRKEIKAGAGLGSMVTLDAAIEHLQQVGLISINPSVGSLLGNQYEVFTPEETSTSTSSTSSTSSLTQNVDELDVPESGYTRQTQPNDFQATSSSANTSFKTKEENTDDDAALAGLIEAIKTTSREITGKELSVSESDRWKELAEVLMAELKIAAARTSVSSIPAFLAEHLRRRLWKIDKKQARAEGRELPDEVTTRPQSSINASSCPDCGGSGWWYPEGEAKGVAKCKHEKLTAGG